MVAINLRKILFLPLFFGILPEVYAHCPVCTAAVGTGVVVAEYYGISNFVVGLWYGAFLLSLIIWSLKIIKKGEHQIVLILLFFLSMFSLYKVSNLYTIDFWVGIITGGTIIIFSRYLTDIMRFRMKLIFPFQIVIISLTLLIIISIFAYIFY